MGLIKDLEKVQMRATKLVIKLKHFRYKERQTREIKINNITIGLQTYTREHEWGLQNSNGEILQKLRELRTRTP